MQVAFTLFIHLPRPSLQLLVVEVKEREKTTRFRETRLRFLIFYWREEKYRKFYAFLRGLPTNLRALVVAIIYLDPWHWLAVKVNM